MNSYYQRLLLDRGPLAGKLFGDVPVHFNPGEPILNKGIDWETGILLASFVEQYKPRQIVELGTFRGYSASWLLAAAWDVNAQVDTFDVFPEGHYGSMFYDVYDIPQNAFKYHHAPGGVWNFKTEIPETIDLLYHDTEHFLEPTKKEMDLLLPHIPVGGVVLIDDMLQPDWRPVQDYLKHVFTYSTQWGEWTWSVFPTGHGLGIAEKVR
jgi:predicted O-methyltransferase YrrM